MARMVVVLAVPGLGPPALPVVVVGLSDPAAFPDLPKLVLELLATTTAEAAAAAAVVVVAAAAVVAGAAALD